MSARTSLARAYPRLRPRRQQPALQQCSASSFFFGHRQAEQGQAQQVQVPLPASGSANQAASTPIHAEVPLRTAPHQPPAAAFNSVNVSEIAHFSRLSSQWWDERGEFAFLHRMNPVRMDFVREKVLRGEIDDQGWSFERRERVGPDGEIVQRNDAEADAGKWLLGKDVLDVGCGGGLLTEVSI